MISVRKYGLRAPLNWGTDAREHLWLMNKFWNNLVQIEHDNYLAWTQIFCVDQEFADLNKAYHDSKQRSSDLWKERKACRAKTRSKSGPEDKEYSCRIEEIDALSKDLWKKVKAKRSALKADPNLHIPERIKELEENRKELVKQARQASGLWWPNYNAIAKSYEVARSRALAEGAQLNFHSFTGEGRFTVQLQTPLTFEELCAGESNSVRIDNLSDQAFEHMFGRSKSASHDYRLLRMTIYTFVGEKGKQRRDLVFPISLSRGFPNRALISLVQVTCRKRDSVPLPGSNSTTDLIKRTTQSFVADAYEWHACFTINEPDIEDTHLSSSACGLNLGWRQTADGIRIATLVSRGHVQHIHLPPIIMERLARSDKLKSELDEAANEMRAKISLWIKNLDDRAPEEWMTAAKAAANSKSHDKLYQLILLWNTFAYQSFMPHWKQEMDVWHNVKKPSESDPQYKTRLKQFWACDFRKRREMIGLREKALNYRLTFYQNQAKEVAERYAVIGLGQLMLKKSALTVDQEEVLPEAARSNRFKAGLYELGEWIKKQALKTNAETVKAKRPVTNTCHVCGAKQSVKADELVHVCTKCSSVWDRDVNAANIALQDAIQQVAESAEPDPTVAG